MKGMCTLYRYENYDNFKLLTKVRKAIICALHPASYQLSGVCRLVLEYNSIT